MPPNQSPEPADVGAAVSRCIGIHAASRRWLSFLRWRHFCVEQPVHFVSFGRHGGHPN